jgi:phytoene synthase
MAIQTRVGTAFEAARTICKKHARSFYFSSIFLPREKRYAAYAVYAFCRLLDDATDEAGDITRAERQIAVFCNLLEKIYAGDKIELVTASQEAQSALVAFSITVKQYQIPKEHFFAIAEGCRMDLVVNRYQTWEELREYCYRVAGVVGLIMCPIFGLDESSAEAQAVLMGEAMQLTNILRDVKEDFARGRIYLPLEDLDQFGYTQRNLADGLVNEAFCELMRFEIARARDLYRTGAAGLLHLPNDGSRFTATAMGVIYAGILSAIERQKYNVFSQRARLTLAQKMLRLPRAWRVSRRIASQSIPDVF